MAQGQSNGGALASATISLEHEASGTNVNQIYPYIYTYIYIKVFDDDIQLALKPCYNHDRQLRPRSAKASRKYERRHILADFLKCNNERVQG